MTYKKQLVLDTEATPDVGFELASYYAHNGYKVIMVSDNVKIEGVVADLRKRGASVITVQTDLRSLGRAGMNSDAAPSEPAEMADVLTSLIGRREVGAWREAASIIAARLTPRQREIMEMVLAGHPSKNIAANLGISRRTVENHRASIMRKTGAKSLPALGQLAFGYSSDNAQLMQA